jgi:hypothetical protein
VRKIPPLTQARLLLLTALYAFLLFPLLPVWAQEKKPQEAPSRIYTTMKGDTLWTIAAREFGDPFLWPLIWVYNPHITDPAHISPGEQLNLTTVEKVIAAPPAVEEIAPIPRLEEIPRVPLIEEKAPPAIETVPSAPQPEEEAPPVLVDSTPPTIIHTPPTAPIPVGELLELNALVADAAGVSEVLLQYRSKGDPLYSQLELTLRAGLEYEVQIPGDQVRGEALEYYLEASDALGNRGRQGQPDQPIVVAIGTPPKEEPPALLETPVGGPKPWYQKWWVWTAAGALLTAALMALADRDDQQGKETGSVTVIVPEP